ncbi:MAG: sterol desaturase family protein [Alphaproteobacteria bacterium]
MDALLSHEPALRGGVFLGMIVAMALWEVAAPRRIRALPRVTRWVGNIGIVVINTALVRLLFPLAIVGFALQWEARGWGLLALVPIPGWLAVVIAVIALDLVIYLQHVVFHAVPAFWRLHRMHHADLDFDFTTGTRFHPIEILLSVGVKFLAVAALGAPALAVLIFEILLNATSLFNHGNVALPRAFDAALRWVVVTPDMHRVHHSVIRTETDSNFGFSLPWWDRLFGTYKAQPEAGHDGMTIGLPQFRDPAEQRLDRMLSQPFRRSLDSSEPPA